MDLVLDKQEIKRKYFHHFACITEEYLHPLQKSFFLLHSEWQIIFIFILTIDVEDLINWIEKYTKTTPTTSKGLLNFIFLFFSLLKPISSSFHSSSRHLGESSEHFKLKRWKLGLFYFLFIFCCFVFPFFLWFIFAF